jgi:hypothetical protein
MKVYACQDLAQLDGWIQRSLVARTADELFA